MGAADTSGRISASGNSASLPSAAKSTPAPGARSTPGGLHGRARAVLVAGYLATVLFVACSPLGPRFFWTLLLPALPLFLVVGGFHVWRRVCPLAFFQLLGGLVPRAKQRRAGPWLDRHSYLVSLSILAAALVVRLVAVNGDGVALAFLLVALALAAFVVGALYTGKTWCNFFCPVGIVEKIYTEPSALVARGNSQCPKCTACKKNCPDIEEESGYWKELDRPSRRTAYFLFPGLVLGFYLAYGLPRGTLDDYFDGRWLRQPGQIWSALSPGLWFLPAVPKVVAMPLALATSMALSYALFATLERVLARRRFDDKAASRHLALTLAAFAAFNLFYLFAGQPSLRRVPGLPQLWALVVVCAATLMLVKRYRRREEDFVEEKTVRRVLAKWTWDEPPPRDPKEVLVFVKLKTRERDQVLGIYTESVRDALSDGVVTEHEHKLLERLRAQLGVSKAEHDKIFARLSSEEKALFDPARVRSVEQQLQEEGYSLALQGLLLKRAGDDEVDSLRRSYGVDEARHAELLAEARSARSPLRRHSDEQLARLHGLDALLAAVSPLSGRRAFGLLEIVARKRRAEARERNIELLEALGDVDAANRLRAYREDELAALANAEADPAAQERIAGLRSLAPSSLFASGRDRDPAPADLSAQLASLVEGHDGMLAAAAILALAALDPRDRKLPKRYAALAGHESPLVREAFALAIAMGEASTNTDAAAMLATLARDADERVKRTAEACLAEAISGQGVAGTVLGQPPPPSSARNMLGDTRPVSAGIFRFLPTPARLLALAQIPLFVELDLENLLDLAERAEDRLIEPGRYLCREGEPGDDLYILLDGAGVVWQGENQARRAVGRVNVGDCVGELAVIERTPRTAGIVAEGRLHVLVIGGEAFRAVLREHAHLAMRVLSVVMRRLRTADARGTGSKT